MTISTTTNKTVGQGNGITNSFNFSFLIPAASDLSVYYTDASGNITQLNASQYSVSGINNPAGGSVTYPLSGSPIATGTSITIVRTVPYQQLTSLVNQSGFYPDVVEAALDNVEMQTQQLASAQTAMLQFPVVDPTTNANGALPAWQKRAGMLLSFDANGNPQVVAAAAQSATALQTALAGSNGVLLVGNAADKRDLAAASGASLVGFQQSGSGTVARTVQDRLRDTVSVADFGFLPSASSSANKTALVAAIASLGSTGGEILIPKGVYNCDPGISIVSTQKNITLTGAGNAMGYEPETAGTRIVFSAGTIGFDLTSLSSAGNYTLLRNMTIDGNGVLATGIKIEGMQLLEHVNVTGCTNAGIWLFDNVNQTALNHVSSSYNTGGYGLLVGGTGNTGLNTVFSATHCNFRRNLVGVRIEQCVRPKFALCVIESNTHEGLQIYKGASQCEYIEFDTCWVENNWSAGTATDYNVTIDSATHDFSSGPPGYIRFINCMFYSATSASAINIISAFVAELDHCGGAGAVYLGTYATGVHFKNWNGGTITDAGNRNWQSSTNRNGSEGGGPLLPTAYANRLTVLGTGTTTSCPTGTATTCYTMPSSSSVRYYQVFAKLAIGTANATQFSAYSLIAADSTTKVLTVVNGSLLTITVSGLNIQVAQSSGSTQPVEVAVLPVFPVI